jgi:hypothetical protein
MDVEDIKLLGKLVKYAPSCIENIKGLKLSEQVTLVKDFLVSMKMIQLSQYLRKNIR